MNNKEALIIVSCLLVITISSVIFLLTAFQQPAQKLAVEERVADKMESIEQIGVSSQKELTRSSPTKKFEQLEPLKGALPKHQQSQSISIEIPTPVNQPLAAKLDKPSIPLFTAVDQDIGMTVDPAKIISNPPQLNRRLGAIPAPVPGFIGSIPDGTRLHVVGVYEGGEIDGLDYSPWWSKCQHSRHPDQPTTNQKKASISCHKRYAGQQQPRQVTVHISNTQTPILLAIMAYDTTIWNITVSSDADLVGVIVGGYQQQSIVGLSPTIKVISYTHKTALCGDCIRGDGYFYAYKPDQKYHQASAKLKKITGLTTASFQGAYQGSHFNISNHLN